MIRSNEKGERSLEVTDPDFGWNLPVILSFGKVFPALLTLFEILSFERTGIRAQVLVWSLARKASYSFPRSESK
jgi:hypothetical protein